MYTFLSGSCHAAPRNPVPHSTARYPLAADFLVGNGCHSIAPSACPSSAIASRGTVTTGSDQGGDMLTR